MLFYTESKSTQLVCTPVYMFMHIVDTFCRIMPRSTTAESCKPFFIDGSTLCTCNCCAIVPLVADKLAELGGTRRIDPSVCGCHYKCDRCRKAKNRDKNRNSPVLNPPTIDSPNSPVSRPHSPRLMQEHMTHFKLNENTVKQVCVYIIQFSFNNFIKSEPSIN